MYLLQSYPSSYPGHHRSALGYIMEGKEGNVEKAVNIIKQEESLSNWHVIINPKLTMAALKASFKEYIKEASK